MSTSKSLLTFSHHSRKRGEYSQINVQAVTIGSPEAFFADFSLASDYIVNGHGRGSCRKPVADEVNLEALTFAEAKQCGPAGDQWVRK